jgi:glycosyltransferase involved in cell wall biosynthesis
VTAEDRLDPLDPPGVDRTGDLRGRSVTVVGIYYAPDSTGIAPYTTDLCETLAAAGAGVTAVVGIPHYPQWTVPLAYRRRLLSRERRAGVDVRRVRHFVPGSQDAARRGLYEATFFAAAGAATIGQRPDLVIGVTPNLGGAAAAARLAARRDVPLGIVVQDLVGLAAGQSGIRGGRGLAARVSRVEAAVLARADRVAVISAAFEAPLERLGVPRDRLVRLPNHSRLPVPAVDTPAARDRLGWPQDRRIVVHSGNMGLKQGLATVVDTARLAGGVRDDLLFVLVGDGSTRRELERRAAGLPNLVFLDPLPDETYPLCLAAADLLLLNERRSVLDMSLPSKLTSYLAAGRPIVAATAAASATAAELSRSAAGVRVEPERPAELLAAVCALLDDPVRAARLAAAGPAFAAGSLSAHSARLRTVAFARELLDRRAGPVSRGAGARG